MALITIIRKTVNERNGVHVACPVCRDSEDIELTDQGQQQVDVFFAIHISCKEEQK